MRGGLERLAPPAIWLLGLLVSFHPTFASGFATVQGYPGSDPRLVNFILEHGYRWLAGFPAHRDFWTPPIFHPQRGVGAYTEILAGVAPPYWLARAAGASPATAYQLWMLACWSLNYLAAYVMLRRAFDAGRAPAATGAFVFAFGSARMAAMMHQQLVPYFFPVLAVIALDAALRRSREERRASGWIMVFALALVAQFYSAFYPLYFFLLGLAAALAWALVLPSLRRPFLAFVRRNAAALAAAGAGAALLAAPLAWRYLDAAADVGVRAYDVERLPRLASWLLMGPGNLLYGWVDHLPRFVRWSRPMHHNGVGLVTLLLAAVGLFAGRRRAAVLLVVAATLTVLVATLRLPNDASLWGVTRVVVPGGTAIRAVARVGALLLFPVAAGLALFFESRRARQPAWLLAVLAAVVGAEQLNVSYGYDKRFADWKVERIASAIDPRCEAFFAVATGVGADHELQDDAMWAALASGVPTVNGRSGAVPPGWQLERPWIASERDHARLDAALDAWLARHRLAPERVCRIEVDRRGEATAWASLQRGDDEQR